MIYTQPPENFQPIMQVVACFIEFRDQVLFVQRAAKVSQPGRWCVPGGKVEAGEALDAALRREVMEECGIKLDNLVLAQTIYIRRGELDFVNHMYKSRAMIKPKINLALEENSTYQWLTKQQVQALDAEQKLILDGMTGISLLYPGEYFGNTHLKTIL